MPHPILTPTPTPPPSPQPPTPTPPPPPPRHLQRTQREVQNQLSLRIDDIRSKREEVEVELSAVFDEIGLLLQTKDQTLAALRSLDLPLELARDCSKMREDRQGVDLVDDDVDAQLSEVCLGLVGEGRSARRR